MTYKSIRGKDFGYDENAVIVYGKRQGGDNNPVALGNGNTYYVSSAIAGSDGTSPATAVATIALATAKCTANQGDTVVVLPNHAESITAATALSSKAGIRIIGLGKGVSRPTVTFTTINSATYSLAVAGVYVENILFVSNILSQAAAITLTTAADTWFVNCEFRDTDGTHNYLNIFKSTGAANTIDGLTVIDCKWFGSGTTSVNSFVLSANDVNRLCLWGNYVVLARTATAAILVTMTLGLMTNADVRWNVGISQQTADTGGGFILITSGTTTNTGLVAYNQMGDLSTTDVLVTTTSGLTFAENLKTGVITGSGYVVPTRDS